jgi:fucose permease
VTSGEDLSDRNESLPSPTTAVEHIETWKSPAINMYRVPATFWAFTLMGMNDATYGAIIYYLVDYYGLSYTVISLIFLSPFVGYNLSALLNPMVHMKYGRRGVAIIGPSLHIIAYVMIVVHPPFPVLVVAYCLAGFAHGLLVGTSE